MSPVCKRPPPSPLLIRDKALTANSGRFFSRFSSPPSKIVAREVRSTLENTSNCWQAVDTLVISPWYPASEMSYDTNTRSPTERRQQRPHASLRAALSVLTVRSDKQALASGLGPLLQPLPRPQPGVWPGLSTPTRSLRVQNEGGVLKGSSRGGAASTNTFLPHPKPLSMLMQKHTHSVLFLLDVKTD